MIVDTRFWPLMLELRRCLCEELAKASPSEELCMCTVVPGEPDFSCVQNGKGFAWVRLVNAYPSNSVPTVENRLLPCHPLHGALIEVGVVRCSPVPSNPRAVVSKDAWEKVSELVMSDMAAMNRALCCTGRDFIQNQYVPYGPQGGVVGGVWQANFPQDF